MKEWKLYTYILKYSKHKDMFHLIILFLDICNISRSNLTRFTRTINSDYRSLGRAWKKEGTSEGFRGGDFNAKITGSSWTLTIRRCTHHWLASSLSCVFYTRICNCSKSRVALRSISLLFQPRDTERPRATDLGTVCTCNRNLSSVSTLRHRASNPELRERLSKNVNKILLQFFK